MISLTVFSFSQCQNVTDCTGQPATEVSESSQGQVITLNSGTTSTADAETANATDTDDSDNSDLIKELFASRDIKASASWWILFIGVRQVVSVSVRIPVRKFVVSIKGG
jgi:hypothetical protein